MARGGNHILVVDDDVAIRQALAEILADEGYAVDAAANGAEALAKLREGSLPRLILLDLMMPLVDGWQVAKTIADDPALARIPICVMTASSKLTAVPEHAVAVLHKPQDMDHLLATVERYCGPPDQDRLGRYQHR